jgi:hypothetical protein
MINDWQDVYIGDWLEFLLFGNETNDSSHNHSNTIETIIVYFRAGND